MFILLLGGVMTLRRGGVDSLITIYAEKPFDCCQFQNFIRRLKLLHTIVVFVRGLRVYCKNWANTLFALLQIAHEIYRILAVASLNIWCLNFDSHLFPHFSSVN